MGRVMAVCVSTQKGTQKQNRGSARFLPDWGVEDDAHAGNWHRQVSLLCHDRVEEFRARGVQVDAGAFGENLLVEGVDFKALPVGTRLHCNSVVLELTQIGKECHDRCQIYHQVGDCIMPREGVFARVLQEGIISVGDELTVGGPAATEEESTAQRVAILTLSDAGYAGRRQDQSGPIIQSMVEHAGFQVVHTGLLPDGRVILAGELRRLCDQALADLILTTGGTGFSPTDQTPEATMDVVERPVPGIPEAMRWYSLQITPRAMLSRAVAGIRGRTLIVNLPGSPRAAAECLGSILPTLSHGLEILTEAAGECARL